MLKRRLQNKDWIRWISTKLLQKMKQQGREQQLLWEQVLFVTHLNAPTKLDHQKTLVKMNQYDGMWPEGQWHLCCDGLVGTWAFLAWYSDAHILVHLFRWPCCFPQENIRALRIWQWVWQPNIATDKQLKLQLMKHSFFLMLKWRFLETFVESYFQMLPQAVF
jgi:hypothetical protein